MGWFFHKVADPVIVIYIEDAIAAGLVHRYADGADGGIGFLVPVELQQDIVIHLVDMVAREDEDIIRASAPDKIQVLRDRVGCTGIPVGIDAAFIGLKDLYTARE